MKGVTGAGFGLIPVQGLQLQYECVLLDFMLFLIMYRFNEANMFHLATGAGVDLMPTAESQVESGSVQLDLLSIYCVISCVG